MVSHRSGETEDTFIADLVDILFTTIKGCGSWNGLNKNWCTLQIREISKIQLTFKNRRRTRG
jgi:hypothetical protein